MSAAIDLLQRVRDAGGTVQPDGDRLKLRAPQPLPPDLVDELLQHKAELLATLQQPVPLYTGVLKPGAMTCTVPTPGWRVLGTAETEESASVHHHDNDAASYMDAGMVRCGECARYRDGRCAMNGAPWNGKQWRRCADYKECHDEP